MFLFPTDDDDDDDDYEYDYDDIKKVWRNNSKVFIIGYLWSYVFTWHQSCFLEPSSTLRSKIQ